MDAASSVMLPPFGFFCKAKPLLLQMGGSSRMGVANSAQKSMIFRYQDAPLHLSFARTHDHRTPYTGPGSGGGRSSVISRRMPANSFLGIATSAI